MFSWEQQEQLSPSLVLVSHETNVSAADILTLWHLLLLCSFIYRRSVWCDVNTEQVAQTHFSQRNQSCRAKWVVQKRPGVLRLLQFYVVSATIGVKLCRARARPTVVGPPNLSGSFFSVRRRDMMRVLICVCGLQVTVLSRTRSSCPDSFLRGVLFQVFHQNLSW